MLYVLSTLLGCTGAWWISRYAHVLGLIDEPCARSSHDLPTPTGGGVGMLLAFVVAGFWLQLPFSCWLPAAALSLLSLFSDRIELSPVARLVVQFSAASLFLFGGTIPLLHASQTLVVILFFSIYIVGTANIYNFMDGINGIAGIAGVVGFLLLGGYGIATGQDAGLVMLAFVMVTACTGFLPFNIPKARVFMGDVGSILLGFVFACLVVSFATSVFDLLILTSFLFPFYMDELLSIIERLLKKQSLTKPHRSHLYQVFANEIEIAHWRVSVGYGIIQLVAGLSIWGALNLNVLIGLLILGLFAGGFILINYTVKKRYQT